MTAQLPNGINSKNALQLDESLYCSLQEAASLLGLDEVDVRELMEDGYLTEMPGRTGSAPVQVRLTDVLALGGRMRTPVPEQDRSTPGFLGQQCRRAASHRATRWVTLELASDTVCWSRVTCTSCRCTWRTQAAYAHRLRRVKTIIKDTL